MHKGAGVARARDERDRPRLEGCLHPKKVPALSVADSDEVKQTNEIKTATPMLDAIEIAGRTITADALLTQSTQVKSLDPLFESIFE
jgi:hypothetical protein